MGSKVPNKPNKSDEFEAFLDMLKGESVYFWKQIAEILGVSQETIVVWKQHPKAKEAIREGIKKNLAGMERAGKKDWRMYEAKNKMLGMIPTEKVDLTSGGEKVQPILGGISNNVHKNDSDTKDSESN